MYFSMIAGYKDFQSKFIWYSESNALDIKNSLEYEDLFKAMIEGWRQDFQDRTCPSYLHNWRLTKKTLTNTV